MLLDPRLRLAINTMAVSIFRILADNAPSIYLYGSVTAEDYRHGWSDVDLLVLTADPITEAQADALLHLRQNLCCYDPDTPYYRLFEGVMIAGMLHGNSHEQSQWATQLGLVHHCSIPGDDPLLLHAVDSVQNRRDREIDLLTDPGGTDTGVAAQTGQNGLIDLIQRKSPLFLMKFTVESAVTD